MASLTGQTIASTYDALLKITDNGAITSSLKQITDGLGNNTPLFLSATTLYVNGNLRAGGALYDGNNEPGTNGQFLVSTGTGVDWQNIAESGLITGSGTNGFISKFTASGVIANSVIQESSSNIGIGISPTQKLHVSGNGLFTGTLTASNVSGSTSGTNTGDENTASIKSKLGLVSAIQDGYLSSVDYESFTNKVPSTRTISINGETFDLSANRTYSVNVGVTSFNTRTGAVVLGSGDVTTALGYTPALNSRIMTINGVGYNLSADRTWSVGTVTSVGTSAPLTGGTITSTGTIGISQSGAAADGYLSSTDWNTFNNKQAALGFTPENSANKGANNGYASLDGAGKVPSGQLPSYVDDVVEVANYAALPATGETGKIYITLDTNFVYRWSGTVYVKISEPNAVWGSITGTLSNQTDLQSALNAKVDNTRTITINGTASDLSANRTFNVGTVTSVSGAGSVSGLSLSGSVTSSGSLTLGGTLALTSGDVTTGLGYTPVTNARTLSINGTVLDLTANRSWSVGTVTSVGLDLGTAGTDLSVANSPVTSSGNITLNIPTASAANRGALSSTDWSTFNSKQNTLTLTTTGSSGASTLVGATLNIPTYTLSGLGGQPLLTNPVTGTGTSGYLTRFTGSTSVGNSVIFDNGTQVGIGTSSPASLLDISGSAPTLTLSRTSGAFTNTINFNSGSNYASIISSSGTGEQRYSIGPSAGWGGFHTFYTDTTEKMRILANGNVGIGTTSPASKLHISSGVSSNTQFVLGPATASGNYSFLNWNNNSGSEELKLYTDAGFISFYANTAERMRITSAGNVGIGTTSPSSLLHLIKALGNDVISIGESGNSARLKIGQESGYTGNYIDSSNIDLKLLSNLSGGTGGNIILYTGSGGVNERMRITSGGSVGIGTTNPANYSGFTNLSIGGSNRGLVSIRNNANNEIGFLYNSSSNVLSLESLVDNLQLTSSAGKDILFQTSGANERMRITSGGNVGIGTTSPSSKLTVQDATNTYVSHFSGLDQTNGVTIGTNASNVALIQGYTRTFSATNNIAINADGGNVGIGTTSPSYTLHVNGSVAGTSAYVNLSDERYKKDIQPIENALDKILSLNGVTFNWDKSKTDMNLDDVNHIGLIAQEVEKVLPQAVTTGSDDNEIKSVSYTDIVPVLIEAIKQQQAQIEELKAKLK